MGRTVLVVRDVPSSSNCPALGRGETTYSLPVVSTGQGTAALANDDGQKVRANVLRG
jgi:hypothetical protein